MYAQKNFKRQRGSEIEREKARVRERKSECMRESVRERERERESVRERKKNLCHNHLLKHSAELWVLLYIYI